MRSVDLSSSLTSGQVSSGVEIMALDVERAVVRDRPDVVLHDPWVVASYPGTTTRQSPARARLSCFP
jgi:hypothetical protein